MTPNNLLKKIVEVGLVGRGGGSYPTAVKWSAVKKALSNKKQGYIIVNGAEGEPGIKKDGYILNHYPVEVINGIYWADKLLGSEKIKKIYFFLNHSYYQLYATKLKNIVATKKYSILGYKLEFVIKPSNLSYISGEETALLNLIEGRKVEPRLKPPFPTSHGLYGRPTLINNVETFYDVSLVSKGKYRAERFYTLAGEVKHRGVFKLPLDLSIEEVLRRTNNYPAYKFFVQIGGEMSGEVLNMNQLEQRVNGAGLVMVYDYRWTNKQKLLKHWLKFYYNQSCGQCTICREGTYRLWELINQRQFNESLFWEIVEVLEESSFCGLGLSVPIPLKSYFKNILKK